MQTPQYQVDTLSALKNLPITATGAQSQTLGAIADINRVARSAVVSQYNIQPMGKPRGVSARNLAAMRGLIEVRGLERIGLDPGLIDQGKSSRRAGRKYEFWATDHLTAK